MSELEELAPVRRFEVRWRDGWSFLREGERLFVRRVGVGPGGTTIDQAELPLAAIAHVAEARTASPLGLPIRRLSSYRRHRIARGWAILRRKTDGHVVLYHGAFDRQGEPFTYSAELPAREWLQVLEDLEVHLSP